MKISIIMCAMNSMPYVMASIESFKKQNYRNKELIIVNSKSNDNTDDFLNTLNEKNVKIFKFNGSIYKSLNFGVNKASGQLVGILHSDDIFFSENTLSQVANKYKRNKPDIIYGDVLFSEKNNLLKLRRSWTNINLKRKFDIPPHTSTFITKELYKKYKYDEKYLISSDTDLLIKLFNKKIKYNYTNNCITIMRVGGISTSLYFFFKKIYEDIIIFENHKLSILDYLKKVFSKISQFIIKKNIKFKKYHSILNDKSKLKFLKINNFNKINGKIISALNLAFIAYNFKYNLRTYNHLFWPDGIFSSDVTNVKKIPGRDFFDQIIKEINKQKKNFKKIYVLGNVPSISMKWIKNNLKHSFKHKELPYGSIDKINIELKKINFSKKSIIILTLPTPKQELIANKIIKNYPKSNIICIGGSINILSGYEQKTPEIFYKLNLEWVWRLRFDSKRRILRLIVCAFLFLKLKLLRKNILF